MKKETYTTTADEGSTDGNEDAEHENNRNFGVIFLDEELFI